MFSVDNPYMFTGRNVDFIDNGNLKLQYNRNRYYDYDIGRWMTRDPLDIVPNLMRDFKPIKQYSDGLNFYEYSTSCPTNYIDAFGLKCLCGNDITGNFNATSLDIDRKWSKMGVTERVARCTTMYLPFGWDIPLLKDRRVLGSEGEMCKGTATVSGKCFDQAQINYWVFGKFTDKCEAVNPLALLDSIKFMTAWKLRHGHMPDSETSGFFFAGYQEVTDFSGIESLHTGCPANTTRDGAGAFVYQWGLLLW